MNKRKLGVNLTDQLKILSKDLVETLLKEKMHHDSNEFLGNLLKHYDEYILDIADHFQTQCINMQCCNSCSTISGYTSLRQYYLDVAVPNSKAALTLESVFYNTFFPNLNQCSERLRCESCNSIEAHAVMICRNALPVLIIHLSRNNNAENPTSTPICVPSVLYFDIFFTSGGKGVSYSLVPIIYRFGVSIDVGHYNCTLLESGGKCITFDDVSVTEKLSHDVLLNANDQKYIQIIFYARNACPYRQSFTKDLRVPWVESEEVLKAAEKIIIGDIKCPGNIPRGDIYDLVTGKNITGSIISSFLNVLKVNDVDIEVVCPIYVFLLNM